MRNTKKRTSLLTMKTHEQTTLQLEEHTSASAPKWFELLKTTQTNVLLLYVSPKRDIIPSNMWIKCFLQPWRGREWGKWPTVVGDFTGHQVELLQTSALLGDDFHTPATGERKMHDQSYRCPPGGLNPLPKITPTCTWAPSLSRTCAGL